MIYDVFFPVVRKYAGQINMQSLAYFNYVWTQALNDCKIRSQFSLVQLKYHSGTELIKPDKAVSHAGEQVSILMEFCLR